MRVHDLLEQEFDQACERLIQLLQQQGCVAVVGIKNGGYKVAVRMQELGAPFEVFAAECRRASSATKERTLGGWLYRLPKPVRNGLRLAEHYWREWNFSRGKREARTAALDPLLQGWLLNQRAPVVWVVDDAVDSGTTLQAVFAAIQSCNPQAQAKAAAIVQTFAKPLVLPQVVLYRRVLLRFPWSLG